MVPQAILLKTIGSFRSSSVWWLNTENISNWNWIMNINFSYLVFDWTNQKHKPNNSTKIWQNCGFSMRNIYWYFLIGRYDALWQSINFCHFATFMVYLMLSDWESKMFILIKTAFKFWWRRVKWATRGISYCEGEFLINYHNQNTIKKLW